MNILKTRRVTVLLWKTKDDKGDYVLGYDENGYDESLRE